MKQIRFAIVILFVFQYFVSKAQKVLMEERPIKAANTDFGPNEKNFIQGAFSFGTLVGDNGPRFPVYDLRSNEFSFGYRYKRKLGSVFSIGLEMSYHYASYNISQLNTPTITDILFWNGAHIKHDRERFSTNAIPVKGFLRINLDPKRGNYMGTYIDFGGGVEFILTKEYLAVDNKPDGSQMTTSYTKLPFMSDIGYSTFARIGFDWLEVYFNYRMSGLFKSQYNLPEPPVYSIGVGFNPYGH